MQDYERYRAEYERLRDDLLQRDHTATQPPPADPERRRHHEFA